MILGKMKQCGAQANAARCISHRSVLQRASQRTAFVASPFCRARCIRYTKTIHPARCIRPFTFERSRSASRKSGRGSRGKGIASQDSTEAHQPGMPTDLGRRRKEYHPFSPSKHPRSPGSMHRPLQKAPRKQQAACIAPYKKPQESSRQNDWPRGAFWACFRFTMAHFQQLGEKSRARGL